MDQKQDVSDTGVENTSEFSVEEIDDLIQSLEQKPESVSDLTDDQLKALERRLNPYGSTIYGDEKYTALSFTNIREEYIKKLMTTALVGFNYQLCSEWQADLNDLKNPVIKEDYMQTVSNPDKLNKDLVNGMYEQYINSEKEKLVKEGVSPDSLSEEEALKLAADAKRFVSESLQDKVVFDNNGFVEEQERRLKLQSAEEQEVIKRWLNTFFKYDPMISAKSAHTPSSRENDPERSAVELSSVKPFDTVLSADYFSAFTHFFEINYEKLREAVKYMYEEKPDLEVAVNVYGTFDSLDECNDFISKNKNKVITNVLTVTNNKWNLIGPFKQNRERMNFYNKNTQILENMLKKREEDSKLGKDLLKNRIRKRKVKNIKQYGKDHPSFLKYKKQHNIGVFDDDVEDITVEGDVVNVTHNVEISETGSKIDDDGVPEDAIEIGVTSINLKTQQVAQSKIYSKAEDPTS